MSAPQEIISLTRRFGLNLQDYKSGQYNETQLRHEYLDPFFEVLGWDVNNKSGYAEAYKDVIHEDSIKIGGLTKAPDYCFRIGGSRKFFVEAKKPAVNIKEDINPAFQLRRYAWSARLPLSILTDFEEFAVYDCRVKPDKADKPATARTLFITFQEYEKRWDEIASIFSLEAIRKGSFDRYAESEKKKKGTAEVDAAFLKEIESWRELLARNIALRNPALSQRELNFAVQQTIDRIIFLRICEDRGIEEYNRLYSVLNGVNVYQRLCQLFRRADDKYNSGLFHFTREKEREEPDELTLNLAIDDNPLKEIIKSLYYPDSPYEFSVLPADILGQVYEQFLGKVIRLTDGHRAVVEDKPEVKKAGGVYYTPTYIVDYIVKNTVGQLLGNSTPLSHPLPNTSQSPHLSRGELKGGNNSAIRTPQSAFKNITPKEASKLRILDPACGSGSFLIGAFQYLLDWHRDWYAGNDPQKWAKAKSPVLFQAHGGEWRLTTTEKKRILLNNIYGVDIDPQAVEVTKLSLLLKVLEGESEESLNAQLKMFHERALPDLGNNIKCGNSLIGPDFYNSPLGNGRHPSLSPLAKGGYRGVEQQLFSFDDEERFRINVFDWEKEFPEIFSSDKNPPQSPFKKGAKSSPPFLKEGQGGFGAGGFDAVIGNPPYGAAFSTKETEYFKNAYMVFSGVKDVYAFFIEKCLQLLRNGGAFSFIVPSAWLGGPDYQRLRELFLAYRIKNIVLLPFDVFADAYVDTAVFVVEKHAHTLSHKVLTYNYGKKDKINNIALSLYDHEQVNQSEWSNTEGMKFILAPKALQILAKIKKQTTCNLGDIVEIKRGVLFDKSLLTGHKTSQTSYQYFEGDVYRYRLNLVTNNWIEFNEKIKERPKELKWFEGERILLRRLVNRQQRLMASCALESFITNKNLYSILLRDKSIDIFAVLCIVNSRLISYLYLNQVTQATKDDFPQVTIKDIIALPFPLSIDKAHHDKMVKLVEQMLALNKQLASSKTAHEKTNLQRQIDATDRQIDNLVYELYGLTEEEIGVVEGG